MAAIQGMLEQLNRDISETKMMIERQRQELREDEYTDYREMRMAQGELVTLERELRRLEERRDLQVGHGIDRYTKRIPHAASEFGVGVGSDVMGIVESLHARVRTLEAGLKNFA